MTYVVYHTVRKNIVSRHETEKGAKTSCTAKRRKDVNHDVAEETVYHLAIKEFRTVKNLMSGKDVVIDSNTPLICDPSSETYWSS